MTNEIDPHNYILARPNADGSITILDSAFDEDKAKERAAGLALADPNAPVFLYSRKATVQANMSVKWR